MKIHIKQPFQKPEFRPFKLEIAIETPEDLKMWENVAGRSVLVADALEATQMLGCGEYNHIYRTLYIIYEKITEGNKT